MTKRISNIVFTKNRPLQLHGYLESLRRFLPSQLMQTYILYKPELFDAEYEMCFRIFPDCIVVRETNFHRDFLRLFEGLKTDYVLFGIDDLVYFDGLEWDIIEAAFARLDRQLFGFSLRLDKGQMQQDIAAGNVGDYSVCGQTVSAVDWTCGQTSCTRYPFELCATIYRTEDIRRLFGAVMSQSRFVNRWFYPGSPFMTLYGRVLKARKVYKKYGFFYNPNTLESWCCRYMQRHPEPFGRLLACQKICASAIQVNRVNTSTANDWDDSPELTVDRLAEAYRGGGILDIDWVIRNKPAATHSDARFFHLKNAKPERS